jgi:type IV pilus assembly protein PilC
MPRYAYQAADAQGTLNRGAMEARHEQDLYDTLRKRGWNLIECKESATAGGGVFSKKLPLEEQVLFCRHLMALVKAGVPVHLALNDVGEMGRNRSMRAVLKEIHNMVLQGSSLSAAFENQGRFDPLFPLLMRAGENTGRLPSALSWLHESLNWKKDYSTRLKRMMVYPIVQISLAAAATLVLMFVAVPQIIQLLDSLGQGLPWYSEGLLIGVKGFGIVLGMIVVTALVMAAVLPVLRKVSGKMAALVDGFVLGLPFLGPLLSKMALAQLSQLFAALLESGLAMSDALHVLPRLTENKALGQELEKTRQYVADGQGFTKAFERGMHLPPYMARLLKVGEDGGDLSPSLKHIAALYQQEGTEALESILKGSGLFVTIMVGIVLAAIVLGVVYPLYQGLGTVMGQ